MRILLFLLLLISLLLPATTLAQTTYDLSCDNIARMRIGRLDDTYWNVESHQGHFHILMIDLKPEAAKTYLKLRETAPWVTITYRGEDHTLKDIAITANGGPLQNDAPALTGFGDQDLIITIIKEQDALDAARAVCPALAPGTIIIDWEKDGND